ncbi:MAG TPA: ABATE domain-containing protein [Anaerolineales bacterium]|nr:ABATE domain-containing protein [Anaerolineales bacterium]
MRNTSNSPGKLCLDFANSVNWHASDHPEESLHSYGDLVQWGLRAGVLSPRESKRLLEAWGRSRREATRVFERALHLREAIYRICVAHLHRQAPPAKDLDRLNRELEVAHRHLRLSGSRDGFHLVWADDAPRLDRVLWHVARSAADLLTSAEWLSRLGQCADDRGCGWLFLDASRNRSRRWCDIKDCGNRAKQRRHYARSHGLRSS